MTLESYIKKYEIKTKEKFKPHKWFKLFYLPERGFCEYRVDKDMVMIYQMCGDGKFWYDFGILLAQLTKCSHMGAIGVRHVKPYIRLWGYKIVKKEILSDGLIRYYCEEKTTKKKGLCSPAWTDKDNNKQAYFITWEV